MVGKRYCYFCICFILPYISKKHKWIIWLWIRNGYMLIDCQKNIKKEWMSLLRLEKNNSMKIICPWLKCCYKNMSAIILEEHLICSGNKKNIQVRYITGKKNISPLIKIIILYISLLILKRKIWILLCRRVCECNSRRFLLLS